MNKENTNTMVKFFGSWAAILIVTVIAVNMFIDDTPKTIPVDEKFQPTINYVPAKANVDVNNITISNWKDMPDGSKGLGSWDMKHAADGSVVGMRAHTPPDPGWFGKEDTSPPQYDVIHKVPGGSWTWVGHDPTYAHNLIQHNLNTQNQILQNVVKDINDLSEKANSSLTAYSNLTASYAQAIDWWKLGFYLSAVTVVFLLISQYKGSTVAAIEAQLQQAKDRADKADLELEKANELRREPNKPKRNYPKQTPRRDHKSGGRDHKPDPVPAKGTTEETGDTDGVNLHEIVDKAIVKAHKELTPDALTELGKGPGSDKK